MTDILHLQGQKLTAYKGNYDTFERTREEQLKNKQKAFEANERSRSHMQVYFLPPSQNYEPMMMQNFLCRLRGVYIYMI